MDPKPAETDAAGVVRFSIAADVASLSTGLHRGLVVGGFPDGTTQTLPVELLVPESGEAKSPAEAATACDPAKLLVSIQVPGEGFRGTEGRPIPVRANIAGCQGAAPAGTTVYAQIGSHSALLAVDAVGQASGSLVPGAAAEQATLSVFAAQGDSGAAGNASVRGAVNAASGTAPVITRVLTGAETPGAPVPGYWLIAEGSMLATTEADTPEDQEPPESLAGVRMWLGASPLGIGRVRADRIAARLPESLPANAIYTLLAETESGFAEPVEVLVVGSYPQLYARDGEAAELARCWNGETGADVSEAAPAMPGDQLVLSLYGLSPAETAEVVLDDRTLPVEAGGPMPGVIGMNYLKFRVPGDWAQAGKAAVQVKQGSRLSNSLLVPVGGKP